MLAGAGWHQSLLIAVAVLIITCPCALGLAVPAAQVVAASALMKRGLLIKDGSALERLSEVDYALFDKTGTLTLGEPRPVDADRLSAEQKSIALALAQASRHPFSRALVATLSREGVEPAAVSDVSEAAGEGMRGTSGGRDVALLRPEQTGGSLGVDLVIGDEHRRIAFADAFRPDVRETLDGLSGLGVASGIISGDRSAIVEEAGREYGIPALGGVEPAGKLAELDRLAGEGHRVLMIGDGLNDGPALAGAHVSIAPGGASDVSQQASDAVFLGDALMPVALAIRVGRRTMAIVRQNFTLAVIYNVLAVPLAILGYVTPMVAAIAMSASSLVVVGNSLRLARASRG
jgi:Cu2+-exporting ATPase